MDSPSDSGGYEITRLKGAKVLYVSDIGEAQRICGVELE